MRVLHVTPSFYPARVYGGPVRSVYGLCRHLGLDGCEVKVLTTDANGLAAVLDVDRTTEVAVAAGVQARYCRRLMRHTVSPALLRALPRYVAWADVVHLNAVYSFPTFPALLAARLARKPVVWSPRGAFQRWRGSRRLWSKGGWDLACRASAPSRLVFHATSTEEAEECRRAFPAVERVVIPNGVEIPERATPVDASGVLRLAYLGRLDPIKGIENLLMACSRFRNALDMAWSLTIAGAGDARYTESIRTLVGSLALSERVTMAGEVSGDAKRRLFETADVLVLPSHVENFGIVVAEALAHGVPVIASRGTPWKRIEETGCGLWVDNTPDGLAGAIQRISRMPLREMGERGREWMKREFAWELVAARMARLYEGLAANPT